MLNLNAVFRISRTNIKFYSCPANLTISTEKYSEIKPFNEIPGPTKAQIIKGFLPGGEFHGKTIVDYFKLCREKYGDIYLLPGVFGKRNLLLTFNSPDFETVFRNEGIWPMRRGLDLIEYHRKVRRANFFMDSGGLVSEQGENWYKFRAAVNPAMMQVRTVRNYIPKMEKVAWEFVDVIKKKRGSKSLEVNGTFERDINNWSLESVALVALDTELGVLRESNENPDAHILIDGMRTFFELSYKLDVKPSLWKWIGTPSFYKMMHTLDTVTDLSVKYIDAAFKRLEGQEGKKIQDLSVLERLVKTDRLVAIVMAMDMLLSGVDTTTSALSACLLSLATSPEKQEILRKEINGIFKNHENLCDENMKNLPYLRACIKEALRLHPILPANFRSAGQDLVLSNFSIPKGTDIVMPVQILMRDEKYYVRPNEFIPERWFKDSEFYHGNKDPFIFLPFGFGPRMCIGRRISEQELEIALIVLLKSFKIEYNYEVKDPFITNFINVPNIPLKFKFVDL